MPWRSKAQQRWGHTAAGTRALGGKDAVAEWDSATNFKQIPDHVDRAAKRAAIRRRARRAKKEPSRA